MEVINGKATIGPLLMKSSRCVRRSLHGFHFPAIKLPSGSVHEKLLSSTLAPAAADSRTAAFARQARLPADAQGPSQVNF